MDTFRQKKHLIYGKTNRFSKQEIIDGYRKAGQINTKGEYKKDMKSGTWKFYLPNGFLYKELIYSKGKQKKLKSYHPKF